MRVVEAITTDPDGGRVRSLFVARLRSVNYGRHVIFSGTNSRGRRRAGDPQERYPRSSIPAFVYFEDIGRLRAPPTDDDGEHVARWFATRNLRALAGLRQALLGTGGQ